jgi:peptidyl-tRNA hydrolase, PTH1 family
MRLIVGLGNPGPEYQWTPHNLGFLAVDEIANRNSIRVERPEDQSLVGLGNVAGHHMVLAKPQTYMNLSGGSVRRLMARYEVELADLLVMFDERDLPWGMIRIGERGSPGTHNGAKSVTSAVGTPEFARLRLGCGPDYPVSDLADYVLRPMKKAQLEVAAEMVAMAGDAVELVLKDGIAAAMNKYNRRVAPPEEKKD